MTIVSSQTSKLNQSALVLVNAAAVVSGVIREIAGNDISNSINESKATAEIITGLSCQRIVKRLAKRTS